jgi:shikimate dehydrogenase
MMYFGLIGKNIAHSLSPDYFSEKFQRLSVAACYRLCPIENIEQFHRLLHVQVWHGFNVTAPYKESIIPFLDSIDSVAMSVGAVNTICLTRKDNKLYTIGYNTDIIGFERSLASLCPPFHRKALVLGTGGSAKAVAYVLRKQGIAVTSVSRRQVKDTLTYDTLSADIIASHTLIVNATPLGTPPDTQQYPLIPYDALTSRHLLFDLNYTPAPSAFLRHGASYGAKVKDGRDMLFLQADAAYDLWMKNRDNG